MLSLGRSALQQLASRGDDIEIEAFLPATRVVDAVVLVIKQKEWLDEVVLIVSERVMHPINELVPIPSGRGDSLPRRGTAAA